MLFICDISLTVMFVSSGLLNAPVQRSVDRVLIIIVKLLIFCIVHRVLHTVFTCINVTRFCWLGRYPLLCKTLTLTHIGMIQTQKCRPMILTL